MFNQDKHTEYLKQLKALVDAGKKDVAAELTKVDYALFLADTPQAKRAFLKVAVAKFRPHYAAIQALAIQMRKEKTSGS